MKKTFVYVAFVLGGVFFLFTPAQAATIVNGEISDNTTWTAAGSPYILNELVVPENTTLTIEAGTVVKVLRYIVVSGTLRAEGTEEDQIIFTSHQDDVSGDTNNDGGVTAPAPGQWLSIYTGTGGMIDLKNTELRYGGGYTLSIRGTLTSLGGSMNLDHVYIHHSDGDLMRIFGVGATITINNSRFEDTMNEGIVTNGGSTMILRNNVFKNIPGFSIYNLYNAPYPKKIDAAHNYWGDEFGPELYTRTRPQSALIGENIIVDPFLTDSPFCEVNCFSNVLFFPGIMGSRLYETQGSDEDELWFSSFDDRQERMEMNSDGTSKNDVYTKEGPSGITDEAYGNLYKSFLSDLSVWKTERVFNNYAVIPYDWRLSLNDVVMNGKVVDGKLKYTTGNTTLAQSYLYQQAKALQQSSKSGKVTLIGHSNGGLVIKAFIQKLKDTNDPLYNQIDKVIFVGVPQTGTPDSIVSLLYGSKIGMLWIGTSAKRARSLAGNMPTMYNLLPSQKLFNQLDSPIEFKGDNTPQEWKDRYGDKINSYEEFEDFLTGAEGRENPQYNDLLNPKILSNNLFNQAQNVHNALDNWAPAANTEVIQIAGWGLYTVAGLEIVDDKKCEFDPHQLIDNRPVCTAKVPATTVRDKKVLDGDETVLVKSAHNMAESSKVKKYWVDLARYNDVEELPFKFVHKKHKNILEVDTVRSFIRSLLQNNILDTEYDYISNFEPVPVPNKAYTKYVIHSPLHLTAVDNNDNKIGWDENLGRIVENVKGAQYSEIGEIKTILIPKETEHSVRLEAYEQGSFTLDITEQNGEEIVSETKFEAIPALENTVVAVEPAKNTSPATMAIDFTNDGTSETELTALPGEEVGYQNPEDPEEDDTTPPEIHVVFNQDTKDVEWSASDNKDPHPVVQLNSKKIIATDASGNTTEILFRRYQEGRTRLKVQFSEIIYNKERQYERSERSHDDQAVLIYEWQVTKDKLTDLKTNLHIEDRSRLHAEYRKATNITRITEKDDKGKISKIINQPGFVSVKVSTNNKNIIWEY